jgi:TPR repeat protein
MSSDRPEPPGFIMALVLSIMFLIISACADVEPTVDPSMNMHAEDEAIAKLRTSAEGGDASAQNQLGLLYYEGTGVPQNYLQAKQWFEQAAKQGHAGAQTNLGTMYLQGEGAVPNDRMALFWFSQAAEQGNALACAKLGLMYVQGRGVLQDFIQAHMWYNVSAAHGETRSAEARDALAQRMTPAQIAEAQQLAREWKPKMNKSSQTVP